MSFKGLVWGLACMAVVATAHISHAQLSGNCGGGCFQRLHVNRFGGANCGREVHQHTAEGLWNNYCYDDCSLSPRQGRCGCGLGGGRFGHHGCGASAAGGNCCQKSGCFANGFGWPNACDSQGCGRHGRHGCDRNFRTFDHFNQCHDFRDVGCGHHRCGHRSSNSCRDHGGCGSRLRWNDWRDDSGLSQCGSRGRFFRYAVGHEFGCGDICSSVQGHVTSGCGCESGSTWNGSSPAANGPVHSDQPQYSPSDVAVPEPRW